MSGLGMFRLHPSIRNNSSSSDEESQHRSPPGPNPNRVKRALFGPTDHEENLRFVRKELKKAKNEAASKWNFDFDRGTPLEGRFSWEQASVGDVPLPYLGMPPQHRDQEQSSDREKENRVTSSSSNSPTYTSSTSPSLPVTETPSASSSSICHPHHPPDPLSEDPLGSLHDLRTPAPPSSSSTSSSPPSSSSCTTTTVDPPLPTSSSEHQGARTKDTTKERKITEAQFQFRSRKSRSKSTSKLRLKRLGGADRDGAAASRSPSVSKGRGVLPRDSEEDPLVPTARGAIPKLTTYSSVSCLPSRDRGRGESRLTGSSSDE